MIVPLHRSAVLHDDIVCMMYMVCVCVCYCFIQWAGVIDGDQRMFTVTGLSPGVMYRLAMRSRNIAGLSFKSNIVSFETTTSC